MITSQDELGLRGGRSILLVQMKEVISMKGSTTTSKQAKTIEMNDTWCYTSKGRHIHKFKFEFEFEFQIRIWKIHYQIK